jgi:hypothetical protein
MPCNTLENLVALVHTGVGGRLHLDGEASCESEERAGEELVMSDENDGQDVVLPYPRPLVDVTRVKSTLLLASLAAVREHGLLSRYESQLAQGARDALFGAIAGVWMPVELAVSHYHACDGLGLSPEQQLALGRQTNAGSRQHLTYVASTVRSVGLTPWTVFGQMNRFWARTFMGGGVSVRRVGPKDAEISFARCVLFDSPYFRGAVRGVITGLLEVATRTCFVKGLATANTHSARYHICWV